MGTLGRAQAKKCHTYPAHLSSRADILRDGDVESTENISWGNVWLGVRSDGKLLGRRSCPTVNLSRRIPQISSLSGGGLAGFWPTTVHSRRGNSTTTTNNLVLPETTEDVPRRQLNPSSTYQSTTKVY